MTLGKVTIVGAGNVGATAASLLLLKDLADVVLVDVAADMAKGKALDLSHMRSNECYGATIVGSGDYGPSAGSDIVVVTAGVPRKPGMTREDLLDVNARIVRSVLDEALPASPDAIYLFVTNPLDVMVNLAMRISGLPRQRIFGMGGVLDSARFSWAIAEELEAAGLGGVAPGSIDALVIGAHGEAMLPLPRFSKVDGRPLPELLDASALQRVVEKTIGGGAAVVELLKTGSAFYAPASSIALMVEAILKDSGRVLSTCALLEGEYGITDAAICVPAKLGRQGMEAIVELALDDDELAALKSSVDAVMRQTDSLLGG
jgi:malate dehydrogenase